jgi:hypothetical protein
VRIGSYVLVFVDVVVFVDEGSRVSGVPVVSVGVRFYVPTVIG